MLSTVDNRWCEARMLGEAQRDRCGLDRLRSGADE
jgi:hypothetical protein